MVIVFPKRCKHSPANNFSKPYVVQELWPQASALHMDESYLYVAKFYLTTKEEQPKGIIFDQYPLWQIPPPLFKHHKLEKEVDSMEKSAASNLYSSLRALLDLSQPLWGQMAPWQPAAVSAYVPRRLTETFLSHSVIDFSLELRHLRIRTSLNEVSLLTPAQELEHTWDSEQIRGRGRADEGVRLVGRGGSQLGFLRLLGRDVLILSF